MQFLRKLDDTDATMRFGEVCPKTEALVVTQQLGKGHDDHAPWLPLSPEVNALACKNHRINGH